MRETGLVNKRANSKPDVSPFDDENAFPPGFLHQSGLKMCPLNSSFQPRSEFSLGPDVVPVSDPGELLESKYSNNMKEQLLHLYRWCDFVPQGLQSVKGPSLKLQTGERKSVSGDAPQRGSSFLNNLGVTLLVQVKLQSG